MIEEVIQSLAGVSIFTGALLIASFMSKKISTIAYFVASSFITGIISVIWVTFIFSNSVSFIIVNREFLLFSFAMGFLLKSAFNILGTKIYKSFYRQASKKIKKTMN